MNRRLAPSWAIAFVAGLLVATVALDRIAISQPAVSASSFRSAVVDVFPNDIFQPKPVLDNETMLDSNFFTTRDREITRIERALGANLIHWPAHESEPAYPLSASLNVNASGDVAIASNRGNVGIGTAAPTTKLHVSGALTLSESAPPPADPGPAQAQVYISSGKLIVRYVDEGVVRYKYLDLAGTDATWRASDVAP